MTVHVPHVLYTCLEECARQTRRSVEDELIDVLAEAFSLADDRLPKDTVSVLSSLETMPDDALWQVARDSHLLVRVEALARLKERGQDITPLLEPITA